MRKIDSGKKLLMESLKAIEEGRHYAEAEQNMRTGERLQALNKDLFGQNSLQWFEIQLFSESVKGEFTEVQKENSMFPEKLISEFENMIYQSFDDSLQKYTWEEIQKSSYFEITDKFGANDFRPDVEEMKRLFPELEDAETETEAYEKLSGSENCFDMFHFHMDTDQDNYLFVVDSGGSAGTVKYPTAS
ncbi:MAG: hypothetical protein NC489_30980 [Ruminococcus flavefaciens]|nr:hypothetical protein [Ruminococcus flavefaciens]